MSAAETVKLPADVLHDFVPADYPQNKRAILIEGLYCLQRIHQQRGHDDWLGLLAAFTLITQEVCAELHEPDFRNVRTAKGTPFQTRFLPRWERYEALPPGNYKPLSRAERGNLRDLVRHPEILGWRAAQGEHIQRGMTHPNRLINAWKAQQRAKTAKPAVTKPSDTKPPVGSTDDAGVAALRQQLEQANARVAELQAARNADTARIRALEAELGRRSGEQQARADTLEDKLAKAQAARGQRPVARSDAKGDTRVCKLIRKLGDENDHQALQAARALVSELKQIGADLHDLSDAWQPVEQKLTAPSSRSINFAKVEEVVERYAAQHKTGVGFSPILDRVEAAVPETNWRAQNNNREIMHAVHNAVERCLYRLGFKPTSASKDRWTKQ